MPPRKKKPAASKKKSTEPSLPLEEAMEELTGIVGELESGQQPLNEALEKFERGMQLLRTCNEQLDEAAGRIEIVRQMTDDGAEVEPFDGTSTAERRKSESDDSGSGNLF